MPAPTTERRKPGDVAAARDRAAGLSWDRTALEVLERAPAQCAP